MKRNLSDYLVALAVIACSVVLLGALTIALSGYRLQKPTRTLQIDYEDVTGIKVHSEVRYAGAPAGRVIAMRHLSAAQRAAEPNKKDAVRVTDRTARQCAAAALTTSRPRSAPIRCFRRSSSRFPPGRRASRSCLTMP